jgi:galactosamine-6-phosphate isomerase
LLKIEIAKSYAAMSQRAADLIVAELKRRPDLLLCVSAGGTPTKAYERLAAWRTQQPRRFRKMRVLQIDEWGGLAPGSPASCQADLQTKLLDPLGIGPARYHGFTSDAADASADCERIARWLERNGPIDLCLLGLGVNGHVAMNEPARTLTPHAHVARLARSSQKHAMLQHLKRKPRYGLTLGLGDILSSRKILLLANGQLKQAVLKRLMEPRVTTKFPASFLWLHPDATVLCDRPAATLVTPLQPL